MRRKRAEKISELAGNPRSHVAQLDQLKYQECDGETSIQNALEMGLQTLKCVIRSNLQRATLI
jgi:transcription initiation factor TFIIH subunit 2